MSPTVPEVIDLTQDDDEDPSPAAGTILQPTPPQPLASPVISLPRNPTPSTTNLSPEYHRTLVKKRTWLQTYSVAVPPDVPRHGSSPADATLVFAQHEAGTAVCISPNGILLTCAHCVAESADDLDWHKTHWLIFASGTLAAARTLAWDPYRDLALLLITHASSSSSASPGFPHVPLAISPPRPGSRLICIGHPAASDLECPIPGTETGYDTIVLSTGAFRGLAPDRCRNPQDNADIGALVHTCWTYWGHSGAPLVERRTGRLVGVHSSWDDETGMRRGVPWEAVLGFLVAFEAAYEGEVPEGWTWSVR
ncbi:hypothetical protein TOPH_04524 [Tolypocladium ophioglossoides CBS 100239]|uniref:AT hook domain-containing protein family protein n=1 Tax=Tolypocladium ophioglossoides (strain CBS 100239) TaxID=1163406 RepID=A0A0L0N9X9_TOLOC|nr:hypothetical protein TOPH_04524 [Tolypocladium ophioglossoides CBS 100239]